MSAKNIFRIILFILFVGCNSDDDTYINISNAKIVISNDAAVETVEITSNTNWSVLNESSWCHTDKISGSGNDKITITIDANASDKERTVRLFINNGIHYQPIDITQNKTGAGEKYEIPIIFHVLYEDESDREQYIDKNHLSNLLKSTNELFNKKIDMEMTLIAATKDPKGEPLSEPGVNRIKVDDQELDYIAFMDKGNDFGNEILWDLNKYINIFIYKFKTEEDNDNTVLGVSHLPYGIESNPLSGVPDGDFYIDKTKPESYAHCISLNNIFIYDYNINGSTTNFVITLTHELGHYLGLLHPFSRSDGEGNKTDYCDDTPDYDRTLYDAWLDGVFNSTPSMTFDQLAQRESTNGDKFNSTNIMDYYYSSNSEFTSDQKKRIRHVLMYSPMIPGPKLSRSTTRSKSTNIAPPMRYIE